MVKTNWNYFLTFVLGALVSAGCGIQNISETSSPEPAESKPITSAVNKVEKPLMIEVEQKNSAPRQNGGIEEQRILIDGSQYVKMEDAYGNTEEFRFFEQNEPVKYITVQTLVDGTTTMLIRTREGSIKRVKPAQLENPWQSTLREVALLAGVPLETFDKRDKNSL